MAPKKSVEAFKKGEKVRAKWAGSNTFYNGKVIDVFVKTCKVEFDDGTVLNVKHADIKSPSKSVKEEFDPPPKRTRSRSRSTGRKSSVGRSRSRSPARKEKKETTTKKEKKTTPKSEKTKMDEKPKTNNSVKRDEVDSVVKSSLTREKIGTMKEETKSSVSMSSTSSNSVLSRDMLYVPLQKPDSPEFTRMRSSRIAALRSAATISETKLNSKKAEAKYSDDEESEDEVQVVPKGPSKLMQTSHFLFTLSKVILMPVSMLFLAFACTKKQCTVLEVPNFYSKWRDVGNAVKYPLPGVLLFHIGVILLSLIPLGKKVTGFPFGPKKATKEYRINGIFLLLLSFIVFGICSYFGVYMNWGYDKFRALTLSILIYVVFCTLVLHIVSLVRGDGAVESKIPLIGNFFNGVYYNPFVFEKVDLKTSFVRAGLIGAALINLSIVLKFVFMKGTITIPLATTFGMQMIFIIDHFVREEKILSTATYTSDTIGYGFLMTTGFLIPIGLAIPNYYLFTFENKAHVIPHYCFAPIAAIFLLGYIMYLLSGNLKHNFRSNPFSPSLSDVDSIPTSQKKRLISSNLWGKLRHPNYVGLILMAVAWTLPCGITHFTPYGPLVLLVFALIMRTLRLEAECKEKYGPAWNNYVEKVHSRLIPYIF